MDRRSYAGLSATLVASCVWDVETMVLYVVNCVAGGNYVSVYAAFGRELCMVEGDYACANSTISQFNLIGGTYACTACNY